MKRTRREPSASTQRAPARSTDRERRALLAFYDAHARDLPWRRTRDPYAIWVSEIMLQQTRVDTVLRYYDRFLARFPTTHALAAASQDEVLSAWSGLGYYRRARLLQEGVREVVARYEGEVPEDAEARRALPGVGRYTAGAIGSIAFDRPEPIVDGNVVRVLCRLRGIDTEAARADTQARLWQEAAALAEGPRPGALNQALMELGATVCSKSSPSCESCPLSSYCVAHAEGRTHELPVVKKKTKPRRVQLTALAAWNARRDKLLLVRGADALFFGLWGLPMHEGSLPELLHAFGLDEALARSAKAAGQLEHVLSHRHLHVTLYVVQAKSLPRRKDGKAIALAEIDALGTSSLTRKLLGLLDGRAVARATGT